MIKQISIFKYVHKTQASLRWFISVGIALTTSIIFASMTLSNQINAHKKILSALSPYLMTQVETNDRIEIIRILKSVTKSEDSRLVLVKDNNVLATTGDTQEIDLPFAMPAINFELLGGLFTKN